MSVSNYTILQRCKGVNTRRIFCNKKIRVVSTVKNNRIPPSPIVSRVTIPRGFIAELDHRLAKGTQLEISGHRPALIRIRPESGCVANLTASRISAEPVRRVRVFQARTYISCDTAVRSVERYRLVVGGSGEPEIRHDRLPVDEGEPLGQELEAFVEAVRARSAPPVDGEQGRQALDLAYRVREAIAASPIAP